MNFIKRSFLVVAFLLVCALPVQSARASYLIEPHLGYNLSGSGSFMNGTTTYDLKYNGVQYGLRAGYQYLGFFGGLAYTRTSYTWKTSTSAVGATTNYWEDMFNRNEFGVFGGYKFPVLFRLWGAYYFTNTAEDVDTTNYTTSLNGVAANAYQIGSKYKGYTTELGAGYTGLPFVSINFAYRYVVHNEVSVPGGTTGTLGNGQISNNEFVLGLSVPFTLL